MIEIIEFIGEAGSAYFGDFFDLGAKWLWPLFDVSVVLIEDQCRSECKLREIEWHLDVDKMSGCSVFSRRPEQKLKFARLDNV